MKKRVLLFSLFVVYVIFLPVLGSVKLWQDSQLYFAYARNFLDTGVYGVLPNIPDMDREPGYALFFAGILKALRFTGIIKAYDDAGVTPGLYMVVMVQGAILFVSACLVSFHSLVIKKSQVILFILLLLSPSLLTCQREMYSEALAVPLSLFLLWGFAQSINRQKSSGKNTWYAVLCGVFWAGMVLTKAYFNYMSFLFLLLSAGIFFYNERRGSFSRFPHDLTKRMTVTFGILAVFGFGASKAWDIRNRRQFGSDVAVFREANALAGKVARLDQARLFDNLNVAFAASLGSNYCNRVYGYDRCVPFDIRGCDLIGAKLWGEYTAKYSTKSEAMKALTKDMIGLYLTHPLVQVVGSGFEVLRMLFFEATHVFNRTPQFIQKIMSVWHFGGSLIFLVSAIFGLTQFRSQDPFTLALYGLASVFIFYHFFVMSQVTNLVRYIYPIIPFIYLWVALGISEILFKARKSVEKPFQKA